MTDYNETDRPNGVDHTPANPPQETNAPQPTQTPASEPSRTPYTNYTYSSTPSGSTSPYGTPPPSQPGYAQPGYQPNFTLPNYYASPKPPKTPKPRKEKSSSGKGMKALGVAAAFVLFCAGSFGFGYLGSQTALQNAGADAPVSSQPTGADTDSLGSNIVNKNAGSSMEPYTTVEEVAAAAANSVVEITTESVQTGSYFRQQITSGAGSGVIISEDGYIVTNNHVVSGASKITVTLRDGTQYDATLIGTDSKTDIAVVKIEASGLQAAVLGSSADLKVGELAVAIGNPLGQLGGTVTNGIISALDREITIDGETMTLLQTNAAINPGNSGGGLFNSSGELIGVVNAKSGGTTSDGTTIEGLGFAIPIDTAKPIIQDLIDHGYVQGRIDIGMTFLDITDPITAMMYGVSSTGVYVTEVTDGSSADETGIRVGDRIVALDDQTINTSDDIKSILDNHSVGDEINVVVSRNGRQGSGTIILQENKGASAQNGNFLN